MQNDTKQATNTTAIVHLLRTQYSQMSADQLTHSHKDKLFANRSLSSVWRGLTLPTFRPWTEAWPRLFNLKQNYQNIVKPLRDRHPMCCRCYRQGSLDQVLRLRINKHPQTNSNATNIILCMYTYIYICMYVCTYVRMYVCTYVRRVYVCTYVRMYVSTYVRTYVRR